jgi:hypothetical protein
VTGGFAIGTIDIDTTKERAWRARRGEVYPTVLRAEFYGRVADIDRRGRRLMDGGVLTGEDALDARKDWLGDCETLLRSLVWSMEPNSAVARMRSSDDPFTTSIAHGHRS